MEFCSKFGYNYGYAGSDSDSISSDEEEKSLKGSRSMKKEEASSSRESSKAKKTTRKIRKADTNLVAVRFDQLIQPNEMFAGEPIKCKKCEAFMSHLSRKTVQNDIKTWKCEFCYEENDVSKLIDNLDQIPSKDDVTYLIEAAPAKTGQQDAHLDEKKPELADDNYLMYCIDISGSMDTRIPVEQGPEMTRLEGVKAACLENIDSLKEQSPNKRVSLVTFSDNIKFYGDGTKIVNNQPLLTTDRYHGNHGNYGAPRFQQQQQRSNVFTVVRNRAANFFGSNAAPDANNNNNQPTQEIAADILDNKEKMLALANNQDGNLKSIRETHASLADRIKGFRTEGSTALGPGLVFSIGFCSKKAGSQVILCTDGCANVGMGAIEGGRQKEAEKFYDELADYAKERGVSVNVISMQGTDCKLALLGRVADKTNGTMNIVNPLKLGEQFKSILENRVVATQVKAKLIVNKYMYIRDEELETAELKAAEKNDEKTKEELNKQKKSIIIKDIGNANVETEITFEYGIKKLSDEEKKNAPELKEVPFQLQITYTAVDGTKAMRVYTKLQEFTTDRKQAESNLQFQELMWANAAQKISSHALESNVGIAKYKEKQIRHLAQANNWNQPQFYSEQQQDLFDCSSSAHATSFSDNRANLYLKAKKANRNLFK